MESLDHTINLLFTHHWPHRPGVLIAEKEQICGFIFSGLNNKLASNIMYNYNRTVCSKHVSVYTKRKLKLQKYLVYQDTHALVCNLAILIPPHCRSILDLQVKEVGYQRVFPHS